MTTFDFGDGPVPAHRHPNGGGWVAETAQVAENAYVGSEAWVFGKARVCGEAVVFGKARVCGEALVCGEARVCGEAQVYDQAVVCDEAWTWGGEPEAVEQEARTLLRKVAVAVAAAPQCLQMDKWHCGTAHCLAGHAQVLAGLPIDSDTAYRDGIRLLGRWGAPWFFSTNAEVLEMLKEI